MNLTDIELLSKRARQKAARAEAGFFDHPTMESIISSIDHTLLFPASTSAEIAVHCKEALKYGFASVCIPITAVPEASRVLRGSAVKVGTVQPSLSGRPLLRSRAPRSSGRWSMEPMKLTRYLIFPQ